MAHWSGNEAPGKTGILADSCVLPEPRCPVAPTRQHIPDRDNPRDPAPLTPRKPAQHHLQLGTTKFAEEPNSVAAHRGPLWSLGTGKSGRPEPCSGRARAQQGQPVLAVITTTG